MNRATHPTATRRRTGFHTVALAVLFAALAALVEQMGPVEHHARSTAEPAPADRVAPALFDVVR